MTTSKPKDIDEYIARFPLDTQEILEQIRVTIKKVVPEAEETISYGIPTFNLNGTYLIYFAAYKNHIGFYPVPGTLEKIDKDFASFKTSGKGTIQFPLNKPMPLNLITKLVNFRVKENLEKAKKKKQKKKSTLR
ncbi:MAG TPA: DUF1801 domain-containing protein [Cyclobacteriaceae bacterium]|nr:DUF1801 domain-containing protein [Cyclobacteriaceae bacterium]